jgi:hypothetical protein
MCSVTISPAQVLHFLSHGDAPPIVVLTHYGLDDVDQDDVARILLQQYQVTVTETDV